MLERLLVFMALFVLPGWSPAVHSATCSVDLANLTEESEDPRIWDSFVKLHPFDRLRVMSKTREFPPGNYHLDEPLKLSIDRNQARDLFRFLLSLWPENDLELLAKSLDGITSKNISAPTFKHNLKETRGWLKRLRSGEIALSADHSASKRLDRLIVVMGRIRDLEKAKEYKDAASYLPELKKLLAEKYRAQIIQDISRFRPTSKLNFHEWLSGELAELRWRVKEDKIKPRHFHDLRKFVGHLSAIYGALYALDPDVHTHSYFCFLVSLNSKMGEINDELVEDETAEPIEIPGEIRADLKELAANLTADSV